MTLFGASVWCPGIMGKPFEEFWSSRLADGQLEFINLQNRTPVAKELSDNWKTGSSIDVMCDKDRVKCEQF